MLYRILRQELSPVMITYRILPTKRFEFTGNLVLAKRKMSYYAFLQDLCHLTEDQLSEMATEVQRPCIYTALSTLLCVWRPNSALHILKCYFRLQNKRVTLSHRSKENVLDKMGPPNDWWRTLFTHRRGSKVRVSHGSANF